MKFSAAFLVVAAMPAVQQASAFQPSSAAFVARHRSEGASLTRRQMKQSNFDLSGNTWKPDSDKMGSTDTGDFYPENYENEIGFSDGWQGSQATLGGNRDGPQLPGMENLGADAVITGGIETASEIPAGMDFTPSSVPDGEFVMSVASSSSGQEIKIEVAPVCMTFEDFYAAFSPNSHPSLSVSPATGRMDRRGGETSPFTIKCDPKGQAGTFEGTLVINLPEDNSKICYKITANCF
jgi:hypothetical protein